jgi:hypothetical protein
VVLVEQVVNPPILLEVMSVVLVPYRWSKVVKIQGKKVVAVRSAWANTGRYSLAGLVALRIMLARVARVVKVDPAVVEAVVDQAWLVALVVEAVQVS